LPVFLKPGAIMFKRTFMIAILLYSTNALTNPMPDIYYFDENFIRATVPELLRDDNTETAGKSSIVINERFYLTSFLDKLNNYGDYYYAYKDRYMFTNFFGFNYGISNGIDISLEAPLYWFKNRYGYYDYGDWNNGLGDLVISAIFKPYSYKVENAESAVRAGLKLPTGNTRGYNITGTGSHDFFLMACYHLKVAIGKIYANLGYSLTGRNGDGDKPGDALFYKISLENDYGSCLRLAADLNYYINFAGDFYEAERMTLSPSLTYLAPKRNFKLGAGVEFDISRKSTASALSLFLRTQIVSHL